MCPVPVCSSAVQSCCQCGLLMILHPSRLNVHESRGASFITSSRTSVHDIPFNAQSHSKAFKIVDDGGTDYFCAEHDEGS